MSFGWDKHWKLQWEAKYANKSTEISQTGI